MPLPIIAPQQHRFAVGAISMWCIHCHQEVPARPGHGPLRCVRCNQFLELEDPGLERAESSHLMAEAWSHEAPLGPRSGKAQNRSPDGRLAAGASEEAPWARLDGLNAPSFELDPLLANEVRQKARPTPIRSEAASPGLAARMRPAMTTAPRDMPGRGMLASAVEVRQRALPEQAHPSLTREVPSPHFQGALPQRPHFSLYSEPWLAGISGTGVEDLHPVGLVNPPPGQSQFQPAWVDTQSVEVWGPRRPVPQRSAQEYPTQTRQPSHFDAYPNGYSVIGWQENGPRMHSHSTVAAPAQRTPTPLHAAIRPIHSGWWMLPLVGLGLLATSSGLFLVILHFLLQLPYLFEAGLAGAFGGQALLLLAARQRGGQELPQSRRMAPSGRM